VLIGSLRWADLGSSLNCMALAVVLFITMTVAAVPIISLVGRGSAPSVNLSHAFTLFYSPLIKRRRKFSNYVFASLNQCIAMMPICYVEHKSN